MPDKNPITPSNLYRAILCPPSVWMEAMMPAIPEGMQEENPGTKLHRLLEGILKAQQRRAISEWAIIPEWRSPEPISGYEARAVSNCLAYVNERLAAHRGNQIDVLVEARLEVPGLERNGVLDFAILDLTANAAEFVDWKFYRAQSDKEKIDLTPVANDAQFWAYAVALWHPFCGYDITARRFCPFLWDESRQDAALFRADLRHEFETAIANAAALSVPTAEPVPGHRQCKHCGAKLVCEKFRTWATPKDIIVSQSLAPDQLAHVLSFRERLKLLNKMMSDAEQLARIALQNGEEIPGYALGEPRKMRKVIGFGEAMGRLLCHMSYDAVDSCASISLPTLEKTYRAHRIAQGEKCTHNAAKAEVADLLGDLIEETEGQPPVVEVEA